MPRLGDVILNVVYSEDRDKQVTTTDHPIESGLSITDHVIKEPVKISLSGVCTGTDATTRLQKLERYAEEGRRLTYVGRYYATNMLIEGISTTKDVSVSGTAYRFDIDLKQTIIVKTAKYKVKSAGKKQAKKKGPSKRTYVTKKGDTLKKIAQKYYGHSSKSYTTKIYNANKKVLKSISKVPVGVKIVIP